MRTYLWTSVSKKKSSKLIYKVCVSLTEHRRGLIPTEPALNEKIILLRVLVCNWLAEEKHTVMWIFPQTHPGIVNNKFHTLWAAHIRWVIQHTSLWTEPWFVTHRMVQYHPSVCAGIFSTASVLQSQKHAYKKWQIM